MTDYFYPDLNDKLTSEMIKNGYNSEYWGKSEKAVLVFFENMIKDKFGKDLINKKHLDLGCGTGRLIPRFSGLVSSVCALEPDQSRFEKACSLVFTKKIKNVSLYNEFLSDYLKKNPDACFDTVLCSHIFQHIPHTVTNRLLQEINQCCNSDSLIFVTTTFSSGNENQYMIDSFSDGAQISESITADGFDTAIVSPGTLPVCLFSYDYMKNLLESNNFEILHFGVFHFDNENDATNDYERSKNGIGLEHARDAYYILRKRG